MKITLKTPDTMINAQDKAQLAQKGISEEKFNEQMACFEKGFPFLKLEGAAAIGKGILKPSDAETADYLAAWNDYKNGAHKIVKFVPASGAASRMFKDLFAFADAEYDAPQSDFEKTFFNNINEAAFYADLNAACLRLHGKDIPALLADGAYKAVVNTLLGKDGLNYGALPKGLLKFHRYAEGARTPLEEHLVEGTLYAKGKDGKVNVHFTVSPEHRALFEALAAEKAPQYAAATMPLSTSVSRNRNPLPTRQPPTPTIRLSAKRTAACSSARAATARLLKTSTTSMPTWCLSKISTTLCPTV
mgnify:CR=1 FL=1